MSIARRAQRGLRWVAVLVTFSLLGTPIVAGQGPPPPPPPGQALTPDQLYDLVAPIALYPDPLLSQVLVACTYPLEVVQAYQWQQKAPGLSGPAVTEAAQQQNWDPSIQALVMFPDVLKRLNDDVTWTTNLGNAFLAQQQDVMNAVQVMRQQAAQAGRLQSSPQQTVTTTADAGQPVIAIEPVNPNVIYVPMYDPAWIWGPARWYPYPHWVWPPQTIVTGGSFFGFGLPINVGVFFGTGWHGWAGWGWHPGWANHTVTVNNVFIHQYNFNTAHITNVHNTTVWTHDAGHRQGVPYATPAQREQYRAPVRQAVAPRAIPEPARVAPARVAPAPARVAPAPAPERFGNRDIPHAAPPSQSRSAFNGMQNGAAARTFAQHGYSSLGPARSAAPTPAAPRPAPAARPAPAPRAPAGKPGSGPKR